MIHIFTITARNYLSLAITLGDSIALHQPEARFTIFVADGLQEIDRKMIAYNLIDVPLLFGDQTISDLAFKYNITEFCTSIKPAIFKYLLNNELDTDLVFYLDPDIAIYAPLDSIINENPEKTLYLSPHLIDCRLCDDHPYPEYRHLWEGIFNLGFCAVRRTAVSGLVLDWWDERLKNYCYADYFDGLHTDQKWMDYAPVFFCADIKVITNYGVNVAHWNLGERQISKINGIIYSNQQPLLFFHFSGFDFLGATLTKHVSADRQDYLHGSLKEIVENYRQRVLNNNYAKYIKIPYKFSTFYDGVPITSLHRRLYRNLSSQRKYCSLFDSDGEFRSILENSALIDKSAAAIGNYSAKTIDNYDGLTSFAQKILKIFLIVFGIKRYMYLVKFFSRYGRLENHRFLLTK